MRDIALYIGGGLGIVISLIHGWLGETRVIAPAKFPSRMTKDIARVIFQLSTLVWIAGCVILLLTPRYAPEAHRAVVVAFAMWPLLYSALGNFWASRGRHFGWMLLAVVMALAAYGALAPA